MHRERKKDGGTDRSKTSMAEFGQRNLNFHYRLPLTLGECLIYFVKCHAPRETEQNHIRGQNLTLWHEASRNPVCKEERWGNTCSVRFLRLVEIVITVIHSKLFFFSFCQPAAQIRFYIAIVEVTDVISHCLV